jgi:hypothetical protein
MKISKLLQRACDQLNGVIHSRNLYSNGRRFINAHVVYRVLLVTDPYSEQATPFANDGSFVDGNGQAALLDDWSAWEAETRKQDEIAQAIVNYLIVETSSEIDGIWHYVRQARPGTRPSWVSDVLGNLLVAGRIVKRSVENRFRYYPVPVS